MDDIIDFLKLKELFSQKNLKKIVCYVLIGLLLMYLFSGKSRIAIEAIAVSSNEEYIACFESSYALLIRCFHSDGSLAFEYIIPSDIGAGGYCTLWFEEDVLCALFYRTDKIARFSMDGTVLEVIDQTTEEEPPPFSAFSKKEHQYIYDGDEIDVIYDRCTFLGYWFFGAERYLAIIPRDGERKIVYSWTAKEGVAEPTDPSSLSAEKSAACIPAQNLPAAEPSF